MTLPYNQLQNVRSKLGDLIPEGGTEADAMFSDEQLQVWIDSTSNINAAILEGWQTKLAYYADLVNVTDGAASRAMSDAFDHALKMVGMYSNLAEGPANGRTRVGKIVRL